MPIKEGFTDKILAENIAELVRSGKPQQQAIAIAKDTQRKALEKMKSRRERS